MWAILSRMAIAEIRSHPLQLALAFVMITTAAALAVVGLGLTRTTGATYERVLNEANGGHVWLFNNDPGIPARVRDIPGVEAVSPLFRRARVSIAGKEAPFQIMLWAVPAQPPLPSPTLIREGRWPAPGAAEAVFDRSFADRARISLGDDVDVAGDGGKLTLRVVGIGVNNTQAPYPLDRPPDVFVPAATLDAVAGGRYDSSATGVRLKDPQAVDAFTREAIARSGFTIFSYTWLSIRGTLEDSNRPATILLQTFSVFAFLSVGFVLANTVSAQLLRKRREIGLLRAAGLSSPQLTGIVTVQYTILSLVAAGIGIGLGTVVTPLALQRVASVLDTTATTPFEPLQALVVIAVTALVSIVFVFPPAYAAGRGTVLDALHGPSVHASRASRMASLAGALRLPPSARLGLKDAFARPARAWLTIAAMALAAATVAMSLTIEATGREIDNDPRIVGRPPYQLRLTPRQQVASAQFDATVNAITGFRGVESAILERTVQASVDGTDFFPAVAVTGNIAAMPFNLISGRLPTAENEALVGKALADQYTLAAGQSFEITTRGNRKLAVNIVGIIPDDEHDGRVVLYNGAGRGGPPAIDLRVVRGVKPATVASAVERSYPGAFDINDLDARFREDLADQRKELRRIMFSLDAALIGVGLANLLGVLVLTIRERTRELGILRAIGVTRWQLFGAIAVSSGLYAGIGVLVGAPLGYFVTAQIFDYFGSQSGWPDGITQTPPLSWVTTAIVAGVVILVAFVSIPARMVTRMRVSEALREE